MSGFWRRRQPSFSVGAAAEFVRFVGRGSSDPRTELAFLSHADYWRDASRRGPGAAVHEEDGLLLYAGPHPLPALVDGAIRFEPGLGAEEVFDRACAVFGARRRGFSVYALVGRDDDLIAAADEAGMISLGDLAPASGIPIPADGGTSVHGGGRAS